ncbi:glycyl-radical enzyme activating protein [Alkalibacter saccharofermentans]|uniref:Pyruvate formate lyase activating enzyme n=1 Tax=Alkalibacter saccharofermentans DSM 14828 TaxID=1120975 RepID=A0A1M4UY56_9FIRM|nr:glycyl-radical enzyme activating protein [Alkalibacter saccharofermentans]SHE61691.1 pyruvate formate lyase activating enzyme [Alkalibacter saccharofermentans DSM 14828]
MGKIEGLVTNIQRYSIHDGPGIRTIVFLKGCPLKCKWCSNPESIKNRKEIFWQEDKCISCLTCLSVCPEKAVRISDEKKIFIDLNICKLNELCIKNCPSGALDIFGDKMTVDEVLDIVKKDLSYYNVSGGGITLSGGEVMHQFEFAVELLKHCKAEKINTAIETTGYSDWNKMKEIIKYADLIFCDLKLIDEEMHKEYTGVSNKIILENIIKLDELNKNFIVRMPLIPGVNDTSQNAHSMIDFFSKFKSGITLQILPFHKYGHYKYKLLKIKFKMEDTEMPEQTALETYKEYFKGTNVNVEIGGR